MYLTSYVTSYNVIRIISLTNQWMIIDKLNVTAPKGGGTSLAGLVLGGQLLQ